MGICYSSNVGPDFRLTKRTMEQLKNKRLKKKNQSQENIGQIMGIFMILIIMIIILFQIIIMSQKMNQ